MKFLCLLYKMMFDENFASGDEKESDNPGLGCALEMFSEYQEVIDIIGKLKSIYRDPLAVELCSEKYTHILDMYQEQPHLLDRHIDILLNNLIDIIRDKENPAALKNIAFRYIKHITKVRGYKTVVRHLPHEVYDLEPVLQMLENLNRNDSSSWEAGYILLLWLSIIVKVPFDMSRFDDYTVDDSIKPKSVAERILDMCKIYICNDSYFKIPVSYLASNFITRYDIHKIYLNDFLEWNYKALDAIHKSLREQEINSLNAMATLAGILKYGKREDLLPYVSSMLKKILTSNLKSSTNTLLKKFAMKIVQRIGLVFLKPKVASWRYKRGSRSLAENLKSSNPLPKQDGDVEKSEDVNRSDSEEVYVPTEVEEVIEYLLQGLRDSETIIRWSAAKGIGRVTGRLPKELADEVVESVLELLGSNEQDGAWHGGCLTLAELGRRGLLLPQRLPVVVPLLLKALVYEDSRGYYSIGEHVRDAACYVAWSFARAYEAHVLKPYVNTIASGLLIVSLFDREIKCRRAASAAFQENVGRQGTFPHGIDIVTTADYFSVGARQNSFLKISVFVGQFEEYTIPLIDHLVQMKVDHWDSAIRELTASALFNLTPLNPDYMLEQVINVLLKKTKSSDLNCKHGSVIAVAEVIHALKLLDKTLSPEVIEELRQLIYFYREVGYFNGSGGEILRQGFCKFIEKCSVSKIPFHNSKVIDDWQQLMDECLLSEVTAVRAKAASALNPFFEEYYQKNDTENIQRRDSVIIKYISELTSLNQTARLGFCSAFGNFPKFMLLNRINEIISALLKSLKITEYTHGWADARRDIIKALVSIVSTVGIENLQKDFQMNNESPQIDNQKQELIVPDLVSKDALLPVLREIFNGLFSGLVDYTNDSRGDVGAWVREASASGLEKIIIMIAKCQPQILSESLMVRVIGGIGKLAVERIDKTRFHAGKILCSILYHRDPKIPAIPHHEELKEIFPENYFNMDIFLHDESEWFPLFVKMLSFPCYTLPVLDGLISSVGGISERLVRNSSQSLFSFLKSLGNGEELNRICDVILKIFSQNQHDNRVITPLFIFLDKLLGSGAIREILDDRDNKFADEIFRLTKLEILKVHDYRKLINSMDVFCQLVQVKGELSVNALSRMVLYLCHKLKSVRKEAATKLYECLLLYGDCISVPEEDLDEAMTILSDTKWDKELDELRPIRNQLCKLLNTKVPHFIRETPK